MPLLQHIADCMCIYLRMWSPLYTVEANMPSVQYVLDRQSLVAYRLDIDNPIALIVHHDTQQLLQPVQLDAITHRLTLVCYTQHKSYTILECPDL